MFKLPPPTARLPYPYRGEIEVVNALLGQVATTLDWRAVVETARPWVESVRAHPAPFWALESLLREYPIASDEGLALMRLAEALLRVPDVETAIALTADQLGRAQFDGARDDGGNGTPHKLLAGLSAHAIAISKRFLPDADGESSLWKRLGAQAVVSATVRAIQLLGRQFVLGRRIAEALDEADATRKAQPGVRYSYDMLGEGARTEADAQRYLASYLDAISHIAAHAGHGGPEAADGISIKLSALFSRYEDAQRARVFAELVPRVWQLIEAAARADINLTIDAEESDRLELSLDVLEVLAERIAAEHPQWRGFGLAVQSYQTRSLQVVGEVARIARANRLRFMVRLVKGAYWDGEIKRAQEQGLAGYPVFTHKRHSDIAYLACAEALLANADVIYPQFATHNAGTIAAIMQMADARGAAYEMQRLHGMGEGVYRELAAHAARRGGRAVPLRIYAPVGEHRDLLAYLVRRLLENGANSSFVHQLSDASIDPEELLASPLVAADAPGLPLPVDLYRAAGQRRANSLGVDLACLAERKPLFDALASTRLETLAMASTDDVTRAMAGASEAFDAWRDTPVARRAAVLRRAADLLEALRPEFCAVLVLEAKKTLGDGVAEVREAIDFCRYYADEAEAKLVVHTLPGPTGERNELQLHGRGVFACISPWNFPLAIFVGQIAAALVAGNSVVAKPAEQTPVVAARMVALLHEAGVPKAVLQLVHGLGETVGATLVADPRIAGVCFTGSTAVARLINRALAAKDGPIVPLIAETGGINAMIVDSSALPEQVVDAVAQSSFRSAGQRCSALRLLCVHEAIADGVIEMIRGALTELVLGDPRHLVTDVGPVIDDEAFANVSAHIARLRHEARLIGGTPWPATLNDDRIGEHAAGDAVLSRSHASSHVPSTARAHYIAPIAFEVASVAAVEHEIFGPVLHVVRWRGDADAVVAEINALGYGLTLGVQSRIDSRALRIAAAARVGNVYVNRNMIGAVVGVQPFGGEGLSGTGPKAGGPHYLYRFCSEQVVTVNTAAAGGNAALLSGLS